MEDDKEITKITYREKIPISAMKNILKMSLDETLSNAVYDDDLCKEKVKSLSDEIRNKLKGLGYDKYKYIVHVLLGERREQGIRFNVYLIYKFKFF
jgi:hypothetical protein